MAGLTGSLERATVRVLVAIYALAERQSHILHDLRTCRLRLVARPAGDPDVASGQREPRLGVIKGSDRLPLTEVVATGTILAKLSGVCIRVAGKAIACKPQEGAVQVFHFDRCALGGWNVREAVALLALESRVLALQGIASLSVVKRVL